MSVYKEFLTLFSKSQTGALQEWRIWVEIDRELGQLGDGPPGVIKTSWGQVGGAMQESKDVVRNGKNPGKANATTPLEQAVKEAEAKWTKQLKKGYVQDRVSAMNGETDAIIEGGIEPMLAPNRSYPKDTDLVKRIRFPCVSQPKFDGWCMTAEGRDGVFTLWSRTRKRVRTLPHVEAALGKRFPKGFIRLHGEAYNHDYADRFQDLASILGKDEPDAEGLHLVIQFHCYDLPECRIPGYEVQNQSTYKVRVAALKMLLGGSDYADPGQVVHMAPTRICHDLAQLVAFFEDDLADGYEGSMAKNLDNAPYEPGRRSPNQQKMKMFADGEWPIVGVNEGRGKDAGTAATFTCKMADGREFNARLKATYAYRRQLLEKPEMWRGKQLTVTYKRFTEDGMPYIPVAKAIRES
jgi:ATP-dependent DNA ligase